MSSSSATLLLLFFSLLLLSRLSHQTNPKGIDLEHPALDIVPSHLSGNSKEGLLCDRVKVSGISRLKLGRYASSLRVTVVPSVVIPERYHGRIQVFFHRNNSLGLCQCEKDEWKTLQKGVWSSVVSPYEDRYIDLKFIDAVNGPITVAVDEESQRWRLVCLVLGLVLLLLAPVISSSVPFYYSSSMAIGVFLVIIIILFQGMKLLPTGRKNIFYLTIYGSVLGAGSFLVHQFSMLVNSVVVNLGLSEEMHNPVAIFVLLGIILFGAALGYWIVRKYVISEDGGVVVGVAQFVKWAMRIFGATAILQSTLDTPLALVALICCSAVCSLITKLSSGDAVYQLGSWKGGPWLLRNKQLGKRKQAEFHSRSSPPERMWNRRSSRSDFSDSPIRGVLSPSSSSGIRNKEYYSTFHKTRNRKKFTKKEWDDFTRESTREALADWAASSEFTDWIIEHADRIQLLPSDSSDETVGSGSDSTDDNIIGSSKSKYWVGRN